MGVYHEIRTASGKTKLIELTRKSAIFYFCKECMGFQSHLVDGCTDDICPLYPFRNEKASKGTGNKRKLTKEQRKEIGQRLKKGRENKNV